MGWDTIGKADVATGTTIEIKLPEIKSEMDQLSPAQLAAYDKVTDLSNGNPLPWGQGPRRMGTDKNADVLWVGNSWGSSFARIDTKTNAVTMVPFPDKAMQAYHIHVDSKHNVWGNLWTNDQVVKYDPTDAAVDDLRDARARQRKPPRLGLRAQRHDQGGAADLPVAPDVRADAAQRSRHRGAQGAGGALSIDRPSLKRSLLRPLPACGERASPEFQQTRLGEGEG